MALLNLFYSRKQKNKPGIMNFQPIKLHLYLLLFSLTFILTCEDKITDSSKFGAVHVKIVFNNENNSVLNKSLSDDITSITITIPGVDPVNVYVSSGETVSKTIDGVPVGQQTVKIDLKNSAGTIVYTQTKTVQVAAGETSSPSFSAGGFTPENVSITVTSPSGGETWQSGTTHDITWNSSHSDLNIKIELYQGGSVYQTISSSQTNDGSYSWAIPSSYVAGTDYKVRISFVSDANVYDESDGNFTLVALPSITVTNPNGGEEWVLGSTYDITWTSTNVTGNIKIMLYAGGNIYQTISSSESNDGSYSWSTVADAGSNYKVRIASVADATVYDESDGNFTLSVPIDLTGVWSITWDWSCDGTVETGYAEFYADGSTNFDAVWSAESGTVNLTTGTCAGANFSYNAQFSFPSTTGTIYYFWVDGNEASGPMDDGGNGTKDGVSTMTPDLSCNYSISLYDSFGDGWHGNNLVDLYINGSWINQYTLLSGSGPDTYIFQVENGDLVTTSFTSGSYAGECSYYIYDSDNNLVTSDGEGSIAPSGVSFYASCGGGRTSVETIPVLIPMGKIRNSTIKGHVKISNINE